MFQDSSDDVFTNKIGQDRTGEIDRRGNCLVLTSLTEWSINAWPGEQSASAQVELDWFVRPTLSPPPPLPTTIISPLYYKQPTGGVGICFE